MAGTGTLVRIVTLLLRPFVALFEWLTADIRHAAIAVLAVLLGFQLLFVVPDLEQQVSDRTGERDAERRAHEETKAEIAAAEAEADRQEARRLARVKAEQEEITHAVQTDYRNRLAGMHARAERLREELRAAGAGGGAAADIAVPGPRSSPDGVAAAAGDPGLPSGPFGRSAAEQLERDIIASEQALQLNALIDWILQQAEIDPNADQGDGNGPG